VTGGAGGIGWETATAFRNEGAKVVVCDRAGETLERAKRDAERFDAESFMVIEADVSSERDIAQAIAEITRQFGRLDVLVNNAGIGSFQDIEAFDVAQYRRVMDINVGSLFLVTSAALPLLKMSKAAAVVSIGSVHGRLTTSGRADYVASKAAMIGATQALAMDLSPHDVRINLVSPGAIETPMLLDAWAKKAPEIDTDVLRKKAGALHPCGRIGQPEDVAQAVLFLASKQAGFITGTELMVDGGLSCKLAMTTLWDD
jgi:NAD(P)-dependent dehydrogenase (short-subunit alcohol dehydrogenase family)